MKEFINDDFDTRSESEKREIYDYEHVKPIDIEKAIMQKNIQDIKDEISIYATRVDHVLEDTFFGLVNHNVIQNMMYFLKLAVDSNNLNVLRAVWDYGIEAYYHKPWKSNDVLLFVADLIYSKQNYKMLEFFIKKLPVDEYFMAVKTNEERNKYSQKKRNLIFGNFLDISVFCGNTVAMKMLLPKQPPNKSDNFNSFIEKDYHNSIEMMKYNDGGFSNVFYEDEKYSIDTLYSDNQTFYAFDNGRIEELKLLIENGYIIDFSAFDFTYQVANYASMETVNYLIKNYPAQMMELDIDTLLKASNYPLVRFVIKNGESLNSENFIKLFQFSFDSLRDLGANDYVKDKNENVLKCIKEFEKNNVELTDIEIGVKFAMGHKDTELLNILLKLYRKGEMDVTSVISECSVNHDILKILSTNLKLFCNADLVSSMFYTGVRDFQMLLKHIEFRINPQDTINEMTKKLLNLNSVTATKLLIKYKFITKDNYQDAVDYIINSNYEKLLTTLISYSDELGGAKKYHGL